MGREDDVTPARRPSSITRIQQWGLVEVWLADDPLRSRSILITSAPQGLKISAIDPENGERIEIVAHDEDPSKAALRAIDRMPKKHR